MMNLLPLVRSSVPSILEDIIDRIGLIPRYYDEHRNVAKKKKSIETNKVVCGIITNRETRSGLDIENT